VRRTDQRRAAVVALYQHDLTGRPLLETLGPNASLFVRALAYAAADRGEELDQVIDRHAHGWSVQRIQPLERSIMRVALIEMLHPDAAPADTPIPAEGAIEEAVESAKTFCGSEAPAFVNGVLGAVLRELREKDKISSDRAVAHPEEKPESFRIASKPIT
jgi:transcription antitermination protein NusB